VAVKLNYDTRIVIFDERAWRNDAFLSFIMCGLPAGANALTTLVPRKVLTTFSLTQITYSIYHYYLP